MVRVLHVVSAMNRDGLETFIMNVYRKINRDKIQFDFLMHTNKECAYNQEIENLGGKIFSVPSRKEGLLRNCKALDSFFKQHKEYQIVHQHLSSLSYIEPLKAAKKHGVKVRIAHGHSTNQGGKVIHKILHLWNRNFINSISTDIFACSDLAAKWLVGENNVCNKKIRIINNGIVLKNFLFNQKIRSEYRNILNIDNKFVIGHVGRFSYPKNHKFLIDIFKAYNDKNPNSMLLLVGDGELRGSIEEKCNLLQLKDKVIFTGVRTDINNLLQAMDFFLFPSHYEGLPLSLVEAQSSGLLCLASDTITKQVNLSDLISNKGLALTSESWANDIVDICNKDIPSRVIDYRKFRDFDINNVAEELAAFYIQRSE